MTFQPQQTEPKISSRHSEQYFGSVASAKSLIESPTARERANSLKLFNVEIAPNETYWNQFSNLGDRLIEELPKNERSTDIVVVKMNSREDMSENL